MAERTVTSACEQLGDDEYERQRLAGSTLLDDDLLPLALGDADIDGSRDLPCAF